MSGMTDFAGAGWTDAAIAMGLVALVAALAWRLRRDWLDCGAFRAGPDGGPWDEGMADQDIDYHFDHGMEAVDARLRRRVLDVESLYSPSTVVMTFASGQQRDFPATRRFPHAWEFLGPPPDAGTDQGRVA
jgi:hypothetical protein